MTFPEKKGNCTYEDYIVWPGNHRYELFDGWLSPLNEENITLELPVLEERFTCEDLDTRPEFKRYELIEGSRA